MRSIVNSKKSMWMWNWNWNREFESNRETQNSVGLRATRSNALKVLNSGPVSCGEWNWKLSPACRHHCCVVVWGGRSQRTRESQCESERSESNSLQSFVNGSERAHATGDHTTWRARASFVKAFCVHARAWVCVCLFFFACRDALTLFRPFVRSFCFLAAPIMNSCFLFSFLRPVVRLCWQLKLEWEWEWKRERGRAPSLL